ncbi:PleD family two-component system response regulator [Candidatus Trichorickettsia mobilis]|uniref:diguanylate cyclase n=1 Tax=Candidatus Trichorickettsia mobilis TaxID=1346319 RepID=A0ABZ0USG8_9RICK|nr:PleD family two-component system response regulator [Candidatus Trichorickettsia mobilis]WPY00461.1 PleD family two-component system response regulator [Candidatus Trichorickettsia mobilis]
MTANVLIVDDLEPNVKLLEVKLLSEYYTVFSANNGVKALDVLANNKIDVILLDVMMPEMDGFETCIKIKANPETTHIPVVMVTALSDIEDRIKGLEAGADEFLTKPINDVALFARVKSLSRMKTIIDELKLRNKTNAALGASAIEIKDNFVDSKILIINDDVVQARNLSKTLLKLSPQIKIVTKIEDIDSIIDTYIPDVVIISCQLEVGDPLRISVMLKSKEILRHTMLMLLAEEENMQMVIKGMELGINDYFIYPVEENELLARIKTQLRRKKYQDNLRNELEQSVNLSIKDGLTGVFNRRYFDIHIQQMIKTSIETNKPLCLLMLDIDHFKQVNDNYGHQAGDAVLVSFSMVLKNLFRITDLIARYGGEEFSVLLSEAYLKEAVIIADRVRSTIETTSFVIPNYPPLTKTTSIGVAEYKHGESISDFISRADKALYEAKSTGRNKIVAS